MQTAQVLLSCLQVYFVIGAAPQAQGSGEGSLRYGSIDGGIAGWSVCSLTEHQKIHSPSDSNPNNFGKSLAISNDFAVVGAPTSAASVANAGAAFVLGRNGDIWTVVQTLTVPGATGGDAFGAAAAMHNDIMVIGAPGSDLSTIIDAGVAYVFQYGGNQWTFRAKLIASDASASDGLGTAVAVHGNRILLCSPGDDDQANDAGAVYAFEFNGTNWVQMQKLFSSSPAADQKFGRSLAMQSDRAVAGTDTTAAGLVQTFAHDGTGWTLQQLISASDGIANNGFGTAVDIDGDWLVVGAPRDSQFGSLAGAAYVYRFDGTTWIDEQKLSSPDSNTGDQLGTSVGIENAIIVIGAPLNNPFYFEVGSAVSDAGSAAVFEREGNLWSFEIRLQADWVPAIGPTLNLQDEVGRSASIGDGTIILSAPKDFSASPNGSVLFFHNPPPDCDLNGVPDACEFDCNYNHVNDACEVADQTSSDCNSNGSPDECDHGFDYAFDGPGSGGIVFGVTGGSDYIWLNRFTVQPGGEYITHIAALCSSYTPDGWPGVFLLYSDPDNDGDPSDAQLLATAPLTAHYTGVLFPHQPYTIEPISRTFVGNVGDSFFVAAMMTQPDGTFVAVADPGPNLGQSWRAYSAIGKGNIEQLAENEVFGAFNRNWRLRALALDCNGNGVWDQCDIDSGTSVDANNNGIPDECEFTCEGDILADGNVNVDDLLMVINSWGPCTPTCVADIAPPGKPDGVVNVDDLLLVVNNWGPCE